ncbi:hypothetical protein ORI89_09995 [Sphingobacterium sp. UT-1RO-CII-1]|uniref:hypothetical protein n=1 Tax=Sphingobacterium sp. UT-1RO-CII-1 TaxID=2995225 RepID=UPI00227B0A61|nr:hypothetical protein [Sphingobacterium sp. UT-1RO-CII-1]MCY4779981.1 hypothetical protein [Sphingobacterium sp. UT-1RO-CII-1]
MNQKDLLEEIGQIRQIMERSSKFVSISGLSGVLIGLYALIGACLAYIKVYGFKSEFGYRDHYVSDPNITLYLFFVALAVLLVSLATAIFMGRRKAKRLNQSTWNATSKSLFFAVGLPLLSGGILALVFINKGYYDLIAGTLLVFYGLALAAGSTYTFKEVRWLGLFEIVLGLIAIFLPGYGIVFWALGFGLLHIIYGFIVYKKYE